MGFRLEPKSVTLNDLKQRNGHVVCVISQNQLAFGTYYVRVVGDTPIYSATEMQKMSSFSDISLMAIFAGNCCQQGR